MKNSKENQESSEILKARNDGTNIDFEKESFLSETLRKIKNSEKTLNNYKEALTNSQFIDLNPIKRLDYIREAGF